MSEAGGHISLQRARREDSDQSRAREMLVRHRNLIRFGLMAGAGATDLLAIILAALAGAALRQGDLESNNWLQSLGVLAPTYCLAAVALGAYRMDSLRSLPRSLLKSFLALAIAVSFGFCAAFAMQAGARISRLETGYMILIAIGLLFVARIVGSRLLRTNLASMVEPIIVVLTDGGAVGRRAGDALTSIVDIRSAGLAVSLSDPVFFDRIGGVVRDADRVVLAFDDAAERLKWAEAMRLSGHNAEIIADLGDVRPLALSGWQGYSTLVVSRGPLNLGERLMKRMFDLTVTLLLLPILAPIIALCAALIKLDSRGPAFFVQDRVGRNNRTYRCFKLRTMRTDLGDAAGVISASRGDARVTRVGHFLRKTSIDELPQVFNVLIGDMSLVGPRPHALGSRAEGALFWDLVPDYWIRHSMKPGVTGLAQVRGLRGATHRRADIERRVAADIEYINGWSLWLDMKILFLTVTVMLHRNAY